MTLSQKSSEAYARKYLGMGSEQIKGDKRYSTTG